MKKLNVIIGIFVFLVSCTNNQDSFSKIISNGYDIKFENELTINNTFNIGDVRRYGLTPNTNFSSHSKTNKNLINELLKLASSGLKLYFPKGYYKTSFIIKGEKNIQINFNNASFSGAVQIINSKNIALTGTIMSYSNGKIDRSSNIKIGNISILNQKEKNISNIESSGFEILNSASKIFINTIVVDGLGSGKKYRYTHAGLKIYGNLELPSTVYIKKVHIISSRVNGVIIMGDNINIDTIKIVKFGTSTTNVLEKLSNTSKKYDDFVGLWLQKNTNSTYNNIKIISKTNKNVRLGSGVLSQPTIIENITITSKLSLENAIEDDEKTNVIVKRVFFNVN